MNLRKIFKNLQGTSFCFYCNVDSEELKMFLVVVIGGLVAASIFVALGAWMKGFFKNIEDPTIKEKVLKLEGEENGR